MRIFFNKLKTASLIVNTKLAKPLCKSGTKHFEKDFRCRWFSFCIIANKPFCD